MLIEMVEYGCKIEGKVRAINSEIKKNIQETNSEGEETRTQINGLDQKEEINIHPEQNEKARIQKNERGLGAPGITLNIPKSKSLGCQKEKGKSEKLKTYLKK